MQVGDITARFKIPVTATAVAYQKVGVIYCNTLAEYKELLASHIDAFDNECNISTNISNTFEVEDTEIKEEDLRVEDLEYYENEGG